MRSRNPLRMSWLFAGLFGLTVVGGCPSGKSGNAGEACAEKSDCTEPPDDECLDEVVLRHYLESGDCDEQTHRCVYGYDDSACPEGCADGACVNRDICDDATECDAPPDPSCSTPITLTTYSAPGDCRDGLCTYPYTESSCLFGCTEGECQGQTCQGETCEEPPDSACVDSSTVRTYSAPGICTQGVCDYSYTDQTCPLGCTSGACREDSGFTPLSMFRFMDTRSGAPLASGSTTCVQMAGTPSIPATVKAVGINLVAVSPSGQGYLTAYANGTARPDTSTLNYASGQTIANGTIVQVGTGGEICIYVHTSSHVIIDVTGYFASDSKYFPTTPYRRLDTRSTTMPSADSTQCYAVAGQNGIPASATAVVLNVVAVAATGAGFMTAYPSGIAAPLASTLNYASGQTIANGAIVEVGVAGEVCVFVKTASHLILDVFGYFDANSAYVPMPPFRKLDTRSGSLPAAGSTQCLQMLGQDNVPANAKALAINVAAANATENGYLTVYPEGQARPDTSTLNYQTGVTIANNAIVQPGPSGEVCFYTHGATHFLVDVVGYFQRSTLGDPCAGVSCNSPPQPTCVGGNSLVSYDPIGTCMNGTCFYPTSTEICPSWCAGNACAPTWGWDYNLTRRCVRSPVAGGLNYYEDATECPAPDRHWLVAVQAEKTLQSSCAGIATQSLPINAGGALTLAWTPHTDEFGRPNWLVTMLSDFVNHAHPCGANTWTWYAVQDHWGQGGGPLPKPHELVFRASLWYDDWAPSGAARVSAMFSGGWDGHGVIVEVDLASRNWDDAYPGVPDIVQTANIPAFQWVEMDGTAMGLGIPRQQDTPITIRWDQIIPDLVARGYLIGPQNGWSTAATSSCTLSTEVRNDSQSNAVSAELRFTSFRVSDQ